MIKAKLLQYPWIKAVHDRLPITLIKYFFVGLSAATFDIIFFYIFAQVLNFNYLLISVIGFIIATYINYLLSIAWVFDSGSRFKRGKEVILSYIISIAGQGIHLLILFILIEHASTGKLMAKLFATALVFFWNFLGRKYLVFRKNEKTTPVYSEPESEPEYIGSSKPNLSSSRNN